MGLIFTALGMNLSTSKGYYIIPGTRSYPYIYIIFTKADKVNLDYNNIGNSRTNTLRKRNKFRNILEGKKPKELLKKEIRKSIKLKKNKLKKL